MNELIEAYDEYIKFLNKAESDMMGLAVVHGFKYPEETLKRGKELRAKIAELKKSLSEEDEEPEEEVEEDQDLFGFWEGQLDDLRSTIGWSAFWLILAIILVLHR